MIREVADIHSHGNYLDELGEGNNIFSSQDKQNNYQKQIPGYVATPDGHLQRWDPKARGGWKKGKATTISTNLHLDANHYGKK
jgi:hypothetical protein